MVNKLTSNINELAFDVKLQFLILAFVFADSSIGYLLSMWVTWIEVSATGFNQTQFSICGDLRQRNTRRWHILSLSYVKQNDYWAQVVKYT